MINFLWKRKEYRAKFSYVVVWIIVTSESPCNKYIENLFSCCVCVCVCGTLEAVPVVALLIFNGCCRGEFSSSKLAALLLEGATSVNGTIYDG